jgi:protein farnesyltransferase subunit beta
MARLREIPPGETPSAGTSDPGSGSEYEETESFYLPELFTALPILRDALQTDTSQKQDATVQECLPLLANLVDGDFNQNGVPHIDRRRHARFLHNSLRRLPPAFVSADSSRPWLLYWSLSALRLLGEDVSAQFRDRLVETVRPMQNPTGGFGGGFGQLSHMATTYAIVLALALVGGADAYEAVDRRALWKWLGLLKCPDGGFRMSLGGEEDIRGAYCAAVVISLLNLPLDLPPGCPAAAALTEINQEPNLFTGLGDYVTRCQTFEGGISGQPDAEAHGAYAFCALGCLAILDIPRRSIPKYLNVPRLIAWLSSRQYAPEGGFSGRTNKLVDGCYSHWVGGCWPLLEACLNDTSADAESGEGRDSAAEQGLKPAYESLFSREGLIRYILCCCQDQTKRGGLRDKPSKPSDAYHSCYTLTGLSSAQHHWRSSRPDATSSDALDDIAEHTQWTVSPCAESGARIFDEEDRVPTVHPVYAIPPQSVHDIRSYFTLKEGF